MIEIRIYYEDTDAGGVVYYANYLRFLERARTELFRDWGLDVAVLMTQDCWFVVTDVAMKLRSSARYNDLVQVSTRLTSLSSASFTLEHEIRRGQDLLVTAAVKMACVSAAMKPMRIPPAAKSIMERNTSSASTAV